MKRLGISGCGAVGSGTAGFGTAGIGADCGCACLLYTSDAADERSSVDLGGRRIIKKKQERDYVGRRVL